MQLLVNRMTGNWLAVLQARVASEGERERAQSLAPESPILPPSLFQKTTQWVSPVAS